jgi:hypothetical protein
MAAINLYTPMWIIDSGEKRGLPGK